MYVMFSIIAERLSSTSSNRTALIGFVFFFMNIRYVNQHHQYIIAFNVCFWKKNSFFDKP